MKFYEKFGNDLFSPNIKVSNILLDNSERTAVNLIAGGSSVTQAFTNGITIDYEISSKQNKLDNWITDGEYLDYVTITFIAFQRAEDINNFKQEVVAKSYIEKSIPSILNNIAQDIRYETFNLSDIVDLNNITTDSQIVGSGQVQFSSLNNEKDIILYAIASIDFIRFLSDNKYEANYTDLIKLISNIYSVEWQVFNILVNNTTLENSDANSILNDVRQSKEITSNLLSLIPTTIQQVTEENPKYISEIFTSFDYEKKLIRNFFFFEINKYITNNSIIKNLYKSLGRDSIEKVLSNFNAINFNIKKIYPNQNELLISTFRTSYETIIGSTNTEIVSELSNDKVLCFSFIENFPQQSRERFKYKIELTYQDPFIKYYYDNFNLPPTGLFYSVLDGLNQVENFFNDPRNTDAKTGKFILPQNSDVPQIDKIVTLFVELINAFSNNIIDSVKTRKIIRSLQYNKSTLQIHIDFVNLAKNLLIQIEQLLLSVGYSKSEYYKTSDNIDYINDNNYFKLDDFDASKTIPKIKTQSIQSQTKPKYYTDSVKQYNISDTNTDFGNEVSYKITNSFVSLKNNQISYNSEYELTSLVSELMGTTIEKIDSIVQQKPNSQLFSKISTSDTSFTKPAAQTTNSKKQLSQTKNNLQNDKISQIISKINTSKQLDTKKVLNFNLSFLSNMDTESLVPSVLVEAYEERNKRWISLDNIPNNTTSSYLARTTYVKGSDIFTNENTSPPITNMYFIYTPKA